MKALEKVPENGTRSPTTTCGGRRVSVPGDRADGEVRRRLRLVHEKFQVNTALLSCHGHYWISLSLVTLIKQLRDEPESKFMYSRAVRDPHWGSLVSSVKRLSLTLSAPKPPFPILPAHQSGGLRAQGHLPHAQGVTRCCPSFCLSESALLHMYEML